MPFFCQKDDFPQILPAGVQHSLLKSQEDLEDIARGSLRKTKYDPLRCVQYIIHSYMKEIQYDIHATTDYSDWFNEQPAKSRVQIFDRLSHI